MSVIRTAGHLSPRPPSGPRIYRFAFGFLLATSAALIAGDRSDSVPNTFVRKADSSRAGENVDSAVAGLRMALDEANIELGAADTVTARTEYQLARLYASRGEYSKARSLYEQSLASMECAEDRDDSILAAVLTDLAACCGELGERTEAERLHQKALSIRQGVLGADHPDVAVSLVSLAELLVLQGRYADAEPLIERALNIQETHSSLTPTMVARCLSALAWVRLMQGRSGDAEDLFRQALSITEQSLGPDNDLTAERLADMAGLYCHQGKAAEAVPLMERALSISERNYGQKHLKVAANLHALALVYGLQGRQGEAESLYRRTLTIREQTLGPDHPATALCLRNLAASLYKQGRYDESASTYERALAIWEKMPQSDYTNLSPILIDYSALCRMSRRYGQALDLAERACRMSLHSFIDNVSVLSERTAQTFSRSLRRSIANYLSCYVDESSNNGAILVSAANIVLSAKGRISEGVFQRQAVLAEQTDCATSNLLERLRTAKLRASELSVKVPDENVTGRTRDLDSLERLADDLETQLAKRCRSFRIWQESEGVNVDRLRSALPDKSVLLEYQRYDYISVDPEVTIPRYLLVAVSSDGALSVRDLGDAAGIDSMTAEFRQHMFDLSAQTHIPLQTDLEKYRSLARGLYDALILPVEQLLVGRDIAFISPDGGLNLISFPALVDRNGEYLIERIALHHLLAGRELMRLNQSYDSGSGLLAMGDPDYDAPAAARMNGASVALHSPETRSADSTVARRSGWDFVGGDSLVPLPGTRDEIRVIVERWRRSSDEPVHEYLGSQASEEVFKAEAPGRRIIHLATHGFCINDQLDLRQEKGGHMSPSDNSVENPLLESGLLLAGANLRGREGGSLEVEDGVLTAYEVSSMNLQGTQMVVLSACETGLGAVQQGEGVYGLRRAFQAAGVRTVISSLWPVPDRETTSIMSELYATSNEPLPARMRRLQLDRIARLRADHLADHPYTWAAFIALGDWR